MLGIIDIFNLKTSIFLKTRDNWQKSKQYFLK
nr:MAG TPA: hypothetical protein [Bacteriophage sp.]